MWNVMSILTPYNKHAQISWNNDMTTFIENVGKEQ